MNRKCPVCIVMRFLGKRWTLLIVVELFKGKAKWKRFSELKARLPGITPKVLSMRLKELEKEAMVKHRLDSKEFPVKSKYALTESGNDFLKVISSLKRWGLKWKVKNEHCEKVDCKDCEL